MQAAQRPQERVLRQIVHGLRIRAQMGDVADHVAVQGAHEVVDGGRVTAAGGQRPGGYRLVGRRRTFSSLVRKGQGRSDHLVSFSGFQDHGRASTRTRTYGMPGVRARGCAVR
ncbi:hypothetical protein GCM10010255_12850 [Streptomyces coeruleofuscus]|uniref:Uncharacterized protein n=1 Tax=Streptomyces coeruleofuscus TaxID=66879 RepID=A0ABP5USG7_9ACTN